MKFMKRNTFIVGKGYCVGGLMLAAILLLSATGHDTAFGTAAMNVSASGIIAR